MLFLSTKISVKHLEKGSGGSISEDLIFRLLFRQICSGNYLISPSSFSLDNTSALDGKGIGFQVAADLIHPSSDEENLAAIIFLAYGIFHTCLATSHGCRIGNSHDTNTWLLGMTSWVSHAMSSPVMQMPTNLELLKINSVK